MSFSAACKALIGEAFCGTGKELAEKVLFGVESSLSG
jgi:hypothetical protein